MTLTDRTPLARTLVAYLVRTAARSLLVTLVPLVVVLLAILTTLGPAEVAARVDWRLVVRALFLLGKVVIRTPMGVPAE